MSPNYFKSILNEDWPEFAAYAEFFMERCDSHLESLFAMALITEYKQSFFNNIGSLDCTNITPDGIVLLEPFSASPSQNGWSIAYLKPQVQFNGYTWDFALYIGHDNGASFNHCKLAVLIEVDGWQVHRDNRERDITKALSVKQEGLTAIRVLEERFKDMREAAEAVLSNTVFSLDEACELREKLIIIRNGKVILK